jgi:hypothetical protein
MIELHMLQRTQKARIEVLTVVLGCDTVHGQVATDISKNHGALIIRVGLLDPEQGTAIIQNVGNHSITQCHIPEDWKLQNAGELERTR